MAFVCALSLLPLFLMRESIAWSRDMREGGGGDLGQGQRPHLLLVPPLLLHNSWQVPDAAA